MLTKAPKGTKDIMPNEVYKWHYVEKSFAEICRKYGFSEVRTPAFEYIELFNRGVGETTDVVQKEMYNFFDKNEKNPKEFALRPEGTSGVCRAFIENKQFAEVQPTKMYYNIPCFRYEKPQAGRLREFHQFGIEVFGSPYMMTDAEVICLGQDFLTGLGIKDLELRINCIGCPKCREKHRQALREFLTPKFDELCETCKGRFDKNPMRIIDCKSPVCHELVQGAPMMLDYLCDECKDAFEELKENLDAMGVEYTVDPGIVRGLDYYTKTAFEFVSNKIGAQGTVCGGGRYDNLMEEIGGPSTPGVGFGLGIERLLLTMEANGIEIPKPEPADVFIAVMGDAAKKYGLSLIRKLRKEGLRAEMDLMARNFKGQFKLADRLNAKYTVVIGDNELNEGKLSIKTMATSEQRVVDIENIVEELKK